MKYLKALLVLALVSTIALSGSVIVGQLNPTLTVRQSAVPINPDWTGQIPVVFQYGTISVPKQLWFNGLHGIAYKQLTYLYPQYKTFSVKSCAYTVYGPSRIYAYQLLSSSSQIVRVFSSVQNNEQATGQQTQQTVHEEASAQVQAKKANEERQVSAQNSGFSVIKLSRAYQIPRVVLAIKYITRVHWRQIRSSPLVRCLQRWEKGIYHFRLYFSGVQSWFEYTHLGEYQSSDSQVEQKKTDKSNLRAEAINNFYQSQVPENKKDPQPSNDEQYHPRQQPIFTVKTVNGYDSYTLSNFRKHAGYKNIVAKFNDHFGRFDQSWISKIQYKVDVDVHYFQFQIQFVPFLVDIDCEAHYYGKTQKAALLQIDEKVFNGKDYQKYVDSWSEIKQFNSYKAFKEANEYVLSQFTYLRFYKVTAAYSALHKNGRYVRLVYESSNGFFTPKGQNQFNMVVYICDGHFYIDRQDFLATNTYSFGKNDWLSLFVKVDNLNTYQAYNRIVLYFKNHHTQFWNAHRIEEIRFKDGLNIIKFRNPSAGNTEQQYKNCVVDVSQKQVKVLNHFDWKVVDAKSLQHSKAASYIQSKFNASVPLFCNQKVSPYGRHYEVSFLNDKKVFSNAYLRYVDAEDLFTEDEWQGIVYGIDFDEVQLPAHPEDHLTRWIADNDDQIVGIVEVKSPSKNTYQLVALKNSHRWRINVNWVRGQWVINSRTLIDDGYYFVTGYPSVNVASCSGYLARIYPSWFNSRWIYSAIEVKSIGYFVYSRVVYRLGVNSYQGIVRTTFGVQNSHTLISWDKLTYLREKNDYGYGINYDWSYGYDSNYFFGYDDRAIIVVDKKDQVKEIKIEKSDLLCSYWDDDKCIACYGDYYADNTGNCVRVEDECQFWKVSGECSRCSYGWSINSKGKCHK